MVYSIIIADDHDVVRHGIKGIVREEEFYHVIDETSDGEETLKKIEEKKPDILLLDISMPKVDGLNIIERICRSSARTRIIIVTVHKSNYYLIEAIRLGAKGYLHKSEVVGELVPALNTVMHNEIYVSSLFSPVFFEELLWKKEENKFRQLTQREYQVVRLVAQGKTSKQIAKTLCINHRTADNHRQNIFAKLGIHKSIDLVKFLIKNKVIDLE